MSNNNKYQPLPFARIMMALGSSSDSNLKDFDGFERVVHKAEKLAEDVERMGDK